MPLTHAERQKQYQEKQKEKYGENAVKEKESRRRKGKRQQNIELNREKDRIRKQRSRLNKAGKTVAISPAYKAVSTLSKAIKKAQSALPKSPQKRATVVKKLSMEAGCWEVAYPQKQEGPTSLSEHLKATVTEFYVRDEISRQATSKRDSIVVYENNIKKTMQKWHLSMNISKVYQMFKQENPDKKIGKSKFVSLQPGHVLLSSQLPRNVCVCWQHQNVALILESLHKFVETFPLYSHVLPQTLVCNSDSDFCWNNICQSCEDAQLFKGLYNLNSNDLDKHVEWYQWEKVPGPNGKEYLEKTLKKGSASVSLSVVLPVYYHAITVGVITTKCH